MDTVKDVFKRELKNKFVAKTFAIALFGSDSEHAKSAIKDFDTLYSLWNKFYPNEKYDL